MIKDDTNEILDDDIYVDEADSAASAGVDDEGYEPSREGFAVFDPGSHEPEEEGSSEEWNELGRQVFINFGDSLSGFAGYMGPVGGLLATLGLAVIIIRLAIPEAANVINLFALAFASGAFIIGVFLLMFHLFHWLSNRAKARELSILSKSRLLVEPCGYLDIELPGGEMLLRCSYFNEELSESPECVVCPHYRPGEIPQPDSGAPTGKDLSSENVMQSPSDDMSAQSENMAQGSSPDMGAQFQSVTQGNSGDAEAVSKPGGRQGSFSWKDAGE